MSDSQPAAPRAAEFSSQPAASPPPPADSAAAFGDVEAIAGMSLADVNDRLDAIERDPKSAWRDSSNLRHRAAGAYRVELCRRAVELQQAEQAQQGNEKPELPPGMAWDDDGLADLNAGSDRLGIPRGDVLAFKTAFAEALRYPPPRADGESLRAHLERTHGVEGTAEVLELREKALAAFPQFRNQFMASSARYSPHVAVLLASIWKSRRPTR